MRITRRLEFDAGHRIPNHGSLCRHLHGHRYAIEVTVAGDIVSKKGDAEQGMVADFAGIKALVQEHIVTPWDHAFLVYAQDTAVVNFLHSIPDHRTVEFAQPPTAEHLALAAFQILEPVLAASYATRVRLEQVRIYETPNCWADAVRGEL